MRCPARSNKKKETQKNLIICTATEKADFLTLLPGSVSLMRSLALKHHILRFNRSSYFVFSRDVVVMKWVAVALLIFTSSKQNKTKFHEYLHQHIFFFPLTISNDHLRKDMDRWSLDISVLKCHCEI